MKRRPFLRFATAAAATALATPYIHAQSKKFAGITLRLNGWGGRWDEAIAKGVAAPLEEKYGLRVETTVGVGAAQLVHTQIQIEAIVFNRVSGLVIGVVTGLVLSVLLTFELIAAGNPSGGGQLDGLQQNVRDGVNGSHIAVPLTNAIGKPIVAVFDLVLPPDPRNFFSNLPVTP